MISRWRFDIRTPLAVATQRTSTNRTKRRKTEQLEQEAPNTSASSDPCVALEHLASDDTKSAGVHTCAEVTSCG